MTSTMPEAEMAYKNGGCLNHHLSKMVPYPFSWDAT